MICKPGTYYGQCSELCGVSHGFMPIVINVVSESSFYNLIWNEYTKENILRSNIQSYFAHPKLLSTNKINYTFS